MLRLLQRIGKLRLSVLVLALLGLGGTAIAASQSDPTGVVPVPSSAMTLRIAQTVQRGDCAQKKLTGKAGTTTVSWVAGEAAATTFKLSGAAGSDWDMAVYDDATGKRVGGSSSFGTNEIVQTFSVAGQKFDVQACRVAGSAGTAQLDVRGVSLENVPKVSGPAPTESLVKISIPNLKAYHLLDSLGIDLGEDASATGVSAILHSSADAGLLRKAGFSFTTLVPDLAAQDRKDRAADAAATAKAKADGTGSVLPSKRTSYRTLDDVTGDLKTMVTDPYPSIAKPIMLPVKTFQGRTTNGVEISSDVNATDDQKPTAVILGLHHAREWPSAELTTEFAIYLAQGYNKDPAITNLLNTVRVVIVPVVNSDGYVESRNAPVDASMVTGDPAGAVSLGESVAPPFGGTQQYRRKNCDGASPSPLTPCGAQYGIDPNRNYGELWGGYGASTDTGSQSYRGTGQWSEPETQAIHQFTQSRPVNSLLTMHNFASLVLRPPGTSGNGLAPDEARLKAIGDEMGNDTGYTSEYSYQLYDTSGTTEDWNYGAAGTYGYTMELGPTADDGGNFHVAYQQGVIDQWTGTGNRAGKGVRAALMTLASAAASQKDFSVIDGYAPAGRFLRLHKDFQTFTSPICTVAQPVVIDPTDLVNSPATGQTDCVAPTAATSVADKLDYKTQIGANGRFAWLVPPSTQPFVYKPVLADGSHKTEAYTLTCEDAAGKIYSTQPVTVIRGQRTAPLQIPCGTTLPTTPAPTPTTTVTTTVTTSTQATPAPAQTNTVTTTTPGTTTPGPTTTTTTPGQTTTTTTPGSTTTTPGTTTPGTTTPGSTPTPTAAVKDKLAPQSKFTKGSLLGTRTGFQVAGTSVDFAPTQLPATVKTVSVALGLRVGKLCRYATASGKFGPKVSCQRTKYLKAHGTGTWTFIYTHKLPKGRYLAWVRGVDVAGNTERKAKARNLTTFTIR